MLIVTGVSSVCYHNYREFMYLIIIIIFTGNFSIVSFHIIT